MIAIAEEISDGTDIERTGRMAATKESAKRMSRHKRQHRRSHMTTMMKYSVISSLCSNLFDGLTAYMSGRGMQFMTTIPLRTGEKITIKKDVQTISVIAVVRWIKESGDLYYKVGAEFI